ncbi:MAG TPA: hypothetical protein PK079_10560 [Leptospiraceae bacterium]|nr:hypothetical protein [Leptospiraceae bacterium]HMX32703.1 hypothetical protein [Leptospiraceae bacterium]HMY32709.1 hypothetical protein [Leptospiraceae bacterium]HMZ62517.1 hypothetical protein [Leptospiraceae bacterium]HNA05749.1 hypothetical protein [Leptospiraceae bacterium]
MITDTELKMKAYGALREKLNLVDVERFISIIQKEKFDYTKWRENILEDLSLDELSDKAMNYYKKQNSPSKKKIKKINRMKKER